VSSRGGRRPSARDRAHFETIARAMAEKKRGQIERAARDGSADGIRVGLELGGLAVWTRVIQRIEDERADAQIELGRLWRRLEAKRPPGAA
jgi:hypothetical protein